MVELCVLFASMLLFRAVPASPADTAKEAELGKTLVAELDRKYKPYQDEAVAGRVNETAQRLAAQATLPFPLTIKLVETSDPIANAVPGGYLILSSGLIRSAKSESELAGMLAHQIAHIAARHGVSQNSLGPTVFVGGETGVCTRFVRQPNALPASFRRASVEWEREANLLAAQYVSMAGYGSTQR